MNCLFMLNVKGKIERLMSNFQIDFCVQSRMKEYILENVSVNMQGGSYIGLFFFSCIAFTIILFLFTESRIQYFNDIDKKILGTKDPFWSNIHGLVIFILLTIVVIDFFFVAWIRWLLCASEATIVDQVTFNR